MSDIYVMQRANGDVFAFDDHGRYGVPLFNNSNDAFVARSRNSEMLVFKPVQLDAGLLKQLVPVGGAAEVEFWLVNNPLINLNRGRLVQPEQLALMVGEPVKLKSVSGNATTAWEDEGVLYSKVA